MLPLKIPNIPSSPVTLIVTAGVISVLNESLKGLSIGVLHVQENNRLDNYISSHADMLINHLGNADILLSPEQTFLHEKLAELEFNVHYYNIVITSPYPQDVPLNTARVGSFLICNPKTAAQEILDYASFNKLEILPVNQGYTKCSICILNENTIITEDAGIKQACEQKGMDALLISKGSVKLKSKEYGFIGGCTGLLDKNKLGVCGNLKNHSDYKMITDFLDKHGIEAISLIDGDLTDIGGIIPLMQENDA